MDYMNLKYVLFGGYELPFPIGKFVWPMAMPYETYDRLLEAVRVTGACLIVRKKILLTASRDKRHPLSMNRGRG